MKVTAKTHLKNRPQLVGVASLCVLLLIVFSVISVSAQRQEKSGFQLSRSKPHSVTLASFTAAVQINPYIKAIPDGTMPSGQMEANSVVVWNAGSDYPYCEVYMTVNNGEEIELGRGHDGKRSIVVHRGSTYDLKMVVYLGDRGEEVRKVANLTIVGRTDGTKTITLGKRNRPGASPAAEAPGTPGAGRLSDRRDRTSSSVTQLPFFRSVRVVPLGDAIDLSFQTFEQSEFFIEVSKESPYDGLPTQTPAGSKLPAAFPAGTRLAAYTLPGMSGVKRQHQATIRSAPGQVLEANVLYHYVITAKAPDGSFRRYIGEFTNLPRTVTVIWERVKIINDGDPDTPFIADCGEIDLWFWANYGQPEAQFAILNKLGDSFPDKGCSDHEYKINRQFTIANAPNVLSLSVSGRDRDTDEPAGSDLFGAAQPAPFRGPHDTGDEEQNVASYEFDLRQAEINTTIPFKLVSIKADGGDSGDLMFEVYGRIVIKGSTRGGN
jgi:hypothetical protein